MVKQLLIIVSLLIFTIMAHAQKDSMTFEACVQMAYNRNLDVKLSQNKIRASKLNVLGSYLNLAPSVSGGASNSIDFNRSTDQNNQVTSGTSYSVNYSVGASLTLFNGFTKLNAICANKYLQKMNIEAHNRLYIELYLSIADKFTAILYTKEAIKASELLLDISKRETERIVLLIDQGVSERVALMEMRSNLSANKLKNMQLRNDLDLKLLELAQLIEHPNPDIFEVKAADYGGKLPVINANKSMEIFHKAQIYFPDLRIKKFEYKFAHKTLQIAKGSLWPSLSMSGGCYSNYYSTARYDDGAGDKIPFETQLDSYGNTYFRLLLNVPIFSAASRRLNMKHKGLALENQSVMLDKMHQAVYKSIETAVKTQDNFFLEFMQATENLSFSKESFNVYLEKYQLGMITTTDFITAQKQLADAESALINAKYKWLIQDELLKIYSGEIMPQQQFK